MVLLFLSRGVPMFASGDEYGRTQNGNNNPWCLDTIGIWNNWAAAGTNAPQQVPVDPDHLEIRSHDNLGVAATAPEKVNPLLLFTSYMAWLRQRHPGLHQATYADAKLGAGNDVTYLFCGVAYDHQPGFADRSLSVVIDCSEVGDVGDLLVLVNMADEEVTYTVPPDDAGHPWRLIVDTSEAHEAHFNHWAGRTGPLVEGGTYEVAAWSIAVLANPKLDL
jgi:glycogen operon protein